MQIAIKSIASRCAFHDTGLQIGLNAPKLQKVHLPSFIIPRADNIILQNSRIDKNSANICSECGIG
jgi:hypothetical protein